MDGVRLTREAKDAAIGGGANLAGVVAVSDMPEHSGEIQRLLPGAKSLLVLAVAHSLGSLLSGNNQAAQYDTIFTYDECLRAASAASRRLERQGYLSVAVPAFIPLDMGDEKKGMRGEICWRRAGVRAGLGSYGENGLLVTRDYGSAVRLVGVLTTAPLNPDAPLQEDCCDHCGRCLAACPVSALRGEGKVNKKHCGDREFLYGYRYFEKLVGELHSGTGAGGAKSFTGKDLRELWQTLMTGNYYYCFRCQSQCAGGKSRI